jgi:hypothetical protein
VFYFAHVFDQQQRENLRMLAIGSKPAKMQTPGPNHFIVRYVLPESGSVSFVVGSTFRPRVFVLIASLDKKQDHCTRTIDCFQNENRLWMCKGCRHRDNF